MRKIVLLIMIFTISMYANFFVIDKGRVVEIVNEPHKNVQIVGSNGKVLKKHKTLASAKREKYKKRYKRKIKKVYKKRRYVKVNNKKWQHINKRKKKNRQKRYVKKRFKHKNKINDMIVIRSSKKLLEFYQNGRFKKLYKVAVGKDGWRVYGKFWVRKKVKWPDWRPTKRIKKEKPNLPDIVYGGPKNPLGARALYLSYSTVRIHGTNNPKSIGKAVSHGCFRMKNKDIMELYSMVKVGTPVYIK